MGVETQMRMKPSLAALLLVATLPLTHRGAAAAPAIAGCPIFPPASVWNVPVNGLPVHPDSDAYVASIGADANLKPDFGAGLYEGVPMGIPYAVVEFRHKRVDIEFAPFEGEGPYADDSDAGPAPIPLDAPIEGGPGSTGDRHVLVVEAESCTLFELYKAVPGADGSWAAVGSVRFDLESNELRPEGMTSADAAGLPIFPGLVRRGRGDRRRDRPCTTFHGPSYARGPCLAGPAPRLRRRRPKAAGDGPALPSQGRFRRFKLFPRQPHDPAGVEDLRHVSRRKRLALVSERRAGRWLGQ